MATETRKETVEVKKEITVCDICGEDIHPTYAWEPLKCSMCGRDVHNKPPCLGTNEEADTERVLCKICAKLGAEYWKLIAKQQDARDKAYERWLTACEEHRYDAP